MKYLKKSKFRINKDLFNKNFLEIKDLDPYNKNILISIRNHYFYINDYELEFEDFHKSLNIMFENSSHFEKKTIFDYRILKENDIFIWSIYCLFNNNIENLTSFYVSLIFKSLIFSSYESNENLDGYKNFDQILTKSCELYENFLIFFNVYIKFNLNWNQIEIKSHMLAIFEYLLKQNLIDLKYKWVYDEKDKKLKSEKFLRIKTYLNLKYLENDFNIILFEPSIKKYNNRYFITGGYYSNMYEIFRKNPNSDFNFNLKNYEYLDKIVKKQWFIDIEWFENIIKIIEIEVDLKNILNVIEKDILIFKESNWKDKNIQKKISKNIRYLNIYTYFNFIKKYDINHAIYFPVFFDFRGRMYYNSSVSITNNKLLRTIYHYGEYIETNYIEKIDDIYIFLLKKYEKDINNVIEKFEIRIKSDKLKISILFVLISIGKFYIKKEKGFASMDEFIENGIFYINGDKEKPKKLEDLIEIESYINILCTKSNKKRVVIKDFTASFFQHLTRLLGPLDQNTLKLANMSNDLNWYDPYSYMLNEYLKKKKIEEPFLKYFKRFYVKKTIMTIPYSVGFNTAWKYFIEEIEDDYKENIDLKKEYRNFFKFIKNLLDNNFFKNPTWRIILFAISQAEWSNKIEIELEKSSVHLIYFEKKKKILDLIIKIKGENIRITKKINSIDNTKIDYDSIVLSVRANWIAMLDAEFLRKLNNEYDSPFYSIHDSILVDWLNIDKLLINCNKLMQNNKFDKIMWDNSHNYQIFSFFIII